MQSRPRVDTPGEHSYLPPCPPAGADPGPPMPQKRRRASKAPRSRSRRWVVLIAGLAIFAGALYVLGGERGEPAPGEIGAASRARLERVLEREDRGTRP